MAWLKNELIFLFLADCITTTDNIAVVFKIQICTEDAVSTLWSLICLFSFMISYQYCIAASYYAEAEPCGSLADINGIYTARYDGTC